MRNTIDAYHPDPPPPQGGLGLVELMISITISLALVIVITRVYLGSRQVYRATDEVAQLQEQGRLALETIGYNIRMAGWLPIVQYDVEIEKDANAQFEAYSGNKPMIEGCTGGFDNSYACVVMPTATSDGLTVRYIGDAYNSDMGAGADCLGQNPYDAAANPNRVIQNRFFRNTRTSIVDGVPITVGQLSCEGNGNPRHPQPLFQGVEEFQVLYGLDSNKDQASDVYKSANDLSAAEWDAVVSARVCLLMRTLSRSVATSEQSYVDCAGASKTSAAGERWIYRRFVANYNLRNRVSERASLK
jgi:type IV pilus assembly protein PilW